MTKPQELQTKVYSIIHKDEIPLESGCLIITSFSPNTFIYLGKDMNGRIWIQEPLTKEPLEMDKRSRIVRILGKPLSLQDLLRAIKKKTKEKDSYAIGVDGDIRASAGYEYAYQDISIDLSKPISEQKPETIEALLKLL